MDTRVTVSVYAPDTPALAARSWRAFSVFAEYERRFSGFRHDSELTSVNLRAGLSVNISENFNDVLGKALAVAAASDGAFDPLVGARTLPGRRVVNVGATWRDIDHDAVAGTVRLPPGTALDLNAVVKGAAIDEALEALGGDEPAMIEAGGDMAVRSLPPGKDRWDIGIRDPRDPHRIVTVLPLQGGAICTSGEYLRGRMVAAEGREHLVGSSREFLSLSVIAPTAVQADSWSTAAYLMPTQEAMEFVERQGGAVLAVDPRGTVLMSSVMRTLFVNRVNA